MPAIGGLLRIGSLSPDSRLSQFRPGIADSLWPIFEIFPFSGDCGRRPGSIYTVWPNLHCNFSALAVGKLRMRKRLSHSLERLFLANVGRYAMLQRRRPKRRKAKAAVTKAGLKGRRATRRTSATRP